MKNSKLIKLIIMPFIMMMSSCTNQKEEEKEVPISDVLVNSPLMTRGQFLDPCVFKDNGIFYLVVTQGTYDWDGSGEEFMAYTPYFTSTDLVNWTYAGEINENAATDWRWSGSKSNAFWSPELDKIGNNFVYYYSLGSMPAGKASGVGVAYSSSMSKEFENVGNLFTAESLDNIDPIDAELVQDNGHNYLFFGNYDGIGYVELSADGLSVKDDTVHYVAGKRDGTQNFDNYTAPNIKKIGDKWYLFVSTGAWYGSTLSYKTVVFSSDSPTGPYKDSKGRSALENGNGDLVMDTNDYFKGPGNVSVIEDGVGAYYIFFHSYTADSEGNRLLCFERLTLDDGYPHVKDASPRKQVNKPLF